MEKEHEKPSFKKWLDNLQQESWQLELIISGFLIYALFSAYGPVTEWKNLSIAQENIYSIFLSIFVSISVFILMLNLCIHLTLRGLWIGSIGMRYVSGDIDYDKLDYQSKFRSFLESKLGSFDRFIASLEKYSSIIFAITFLMVFFLLSFFLLLSVWLLID
ncbi:hypothetical protein [Echinicola sp. 20G]|uniref:hypothetical protein n=1 Tax=Echinicola sp. 20G TaxID=2781961 RepID=UPI0019105295|nr:hypothetical protein [Echinicola sp. 20G]